MEGARWTNVGDGEILVETRRSVEELYGDPVLSQRRIDDAHVEQDLSISPSHQSH